MINNIIAKPKIMNKDKFDSKVSMTPLILLFEEAKNNPFKNICMKK